MLLITDYIRVSAVPISGLLPLGTSATLPSFLGAAGALDFFLGSRKIGADEAHPGMFPKKIPKKVSTPLGSFQGLWGVVGGSWPAKVRAYFPVFSFVKLPGVMAAEYFFKKPCFLFIPLEKLSG